LLINIAVKPSLLLLPNFEIVRQLRRTITLLVENYV
jgi:hypothetical protein